MSKINLQQLFLLLSLLTYGLIACIAVTIVLSGSIPFWYDPARDFLLGLDNLNKPTLIGPTAGIPGIFYGPYWIWLVSIGLLISRDPKIVVFIILTLPYLLFLPFILYHYKSIFEKRTLVIIGSLFMLGFGIQYATQPWNPHVAPLLFFAYVLLLYKANDLEVKKKSYSYFLISGLLLGLITNVHISFGIGISVGTLFYFCLKIGQILINKNTENKKMMLRFLSQLFLFLIGFLIIFLPFLLFEIRHGFQQVSIALQTLSAKGAVVSQTGLDKVGILQQFSQTIAKSIGITALAIPIGISTMVIILLSIISYVKERVKPSIEEKGLLRLLICLLNGVGVVYLLSKNPVWPYHFIGVEVIVLLILCILINKRRILQSIFPVIILVLLYVGLTDAINSANPTNHASATLKTKEYIVRLIKTDAKNTEYGVYIHNAAIYTYDYSYLFGWLTGKQISYIPSEVSSNASRIYLIIPSTKEYIKEDFIHFKTPVDRFHTTKVWNIPDGTSIVRREKLAK